MSERISLEDRLYSALLSVNRLAAGHVLAQAALSLTPLQIVEELVTPVLQRIGEEWERGAISLSQVYMSGRICEDLVGTSLPQESLSKKNHPKIAIATLEDYHALGQRIVMSVVRSAGYELIDYGQGISVDALFDKVRKDGIRILLISALMLRAALSVRDLRDKLDAAGLKVKIAVGGAPFRFDEKLWKDVGADGMARNASDALAIIERFVKEVR